jgi:hypothetical protein
LTIILFVPCILEVFIRCCIVQNKPIVQNKYTDIQRDLFMVVKGKGHGLNKLA